MGSYRLSAVIIAIVFSLTGTLLGFGCARVAQLDIQAAPAGSPDSADEPASPAADESRAAVAMPSPGDILIVGGAGSSNSTINSAEFFSVATGKFRKTGSMKKARAVFGAAALPAQGHQVAIFGGMKGHAVSSFALLTIHSKVLNSAESYDGSTGKFTAVANPMVDGRTGFTATAFPSGPLAGKVLIAGGDDGNGPVNTAEIFDPTNNTFTAAGNTMTDARELHTATLLNDGTVLLAGGLIDKTGDISDTADIFDPATQQFTQTTGNLASGGRAGHTASLLTSGPHAGSVLLVGGSQSFPAPPNIDVVTRFDSELYDPGTGTFAPDNFMTEPRTLHSAVTLDDGRVLISGGMNGSITVNGGKLRGFGSTSNSSEIYDPTGDSFTCINGPGSAGHCSPSMSSTRAAHTATLIGAGPDAGHVLLAGGMGARSTAFAKSDHPLKTADILTISGTTATGRKVSMTAARVGAAAAVVP